MKLGDRHWDISGVALGGNTFGWTADEAMTSDILDAYADLGGTLVDTADVYSAWVDGHEGGESELAMKPWLARPGNRDRLLIATKVGSKDSRKGLRPENIHAAVEESCERLGIDTIDLYYAHFDEPDVPIDEVASAFHDLVEQGTIREIGMSNLEPDRLRAWCNAAREHGYHMPIALQPHFNVVHRAEFESERLDIAREWNLGVFPYFSLASGFLTGKYHRGDKLEGDRAGMVAPYVSAQAFDVVGAVTRIARDKDVAPAAVALAWLIAQPTIAAPLASARNLGQLEGIMQASSVELSQEEIDELTRLSDGL